MDNHILITRRNSTLLVLMRPVDPPTLFTYGYYVGKSGIARDTLEENVQKNKETLLKHFSTKYGRKLKEVLVE